MAAHRGLYKPKFRKNGRVETASVWWMSYVCKGCPMHPLGGRHRESTGKRSITAAQLELDSRRGTAADGKPMIKVNEIMMSELLNGVLDAARIECKVSTYREYGDKIRVHLMPFFAQYRAVDICYNESILRTFIAQKKREEYSESTINGMLTLLTRSFSLARNRIALSPKITKLRANNVRKTFFTLAEYQTLCGKLPDDVRRPIQVMFITGWRSWSEVFSRKRHHVNWSAGKLILEPGESKNSEARIFPFTEGLKEILEEQERDTLKLEKKLGIKIPWLFHHEGEPLANYYAKRGYWKPTRYFLGSWKTACEAAGLVGRIRHDFRRTAIREFGHHGVSDDIGMELAGHKTHKIYRQYKAIGEADLYEEVKKLEARQSSTQLSTKK